MNKILFIDSYYPEFVSILSQACIDSSYDAMRSTLDVNRFGTGSALAFEFSKIGWETRLVIPNFRAMQDAWRMENGFSKSISKGWDLGPRIARVPGADQVMLRINHIHSTIYEQVKSFKPDIVYVQDLNLVSPALIKKIREFTNLVVGEIASPLPPWRFIKHYDMVLSALQPIVAELKSKGMSSHWVPLGFDLRDWVDFSRQNLDRDIDLTFIGSISKHHRTSTLPLMKRLSKESFNLEIYGPTSTGNALSEIGLGQHYKGPAWGSKMSEILANSKMVINRHTEFAQGYATNMRMYESTGMGSLLITDATKNLEVLFRVNEEVITYDDPDDAAGKVMNLLSNEGEIKRIATQAQIRTHTEHTYTQRVQKMLELFTP